MYRNIIVGYNGSSQAEDAVALAKLIADATGAGLTLAGVYYISRRLGGRDPVLRDVEAEHIRQLEETAASVGARAEAVASSSAAHGLHNLAENTGADQVVIGSAHHGTAKSSPAASAWASCTAPPAQSPSPPTVTPARRRPTSPRSRWASTDRLRRAPL